MLVWFVVKAIIMPEAPEHNREYYEVFYPSYKLVMQAWTQSNDAYKELTK